MRNSQFTIHDSQFARQVRPVVHFPSRVVHCALLVVLSLLLAACSFSVPRTVKIGLSAPFEGLYRDLGYEALYGVRLAVRERNESGGIGGRYQVELVALNDLNETQEAIGQAAEMAADPGVLGVLGGWSPETARATTPEYARLGLAFATPEADPELLTGSAAAVAAAMNVRRAAIVSGADASDRTLASDLATGLREQGGTVIGELTLPPGGTAAVQASITEWLPEIQSGSAPDGVFITADTEAAAEAIAALRKAGFEGAILGGPQLGSPLLVQIAGGASEGVVFVSPYPPLAADAQFVERYEAVSGGAPPGPVAGWAYAAASEMLDAMSSAIQSSGRADRPVVEAALASRPASQAAVTVYTIRGGEVWTPYSP